MKQIQISVFGSLELFSSGKCLYKHCVNVPIGVSFPFGKILDSMHVLYGENVVIQFLEV